MTAALTEPIEMSTALAIPYWRLHRFTVEQYHTMIDVGLFVGKARVELLDGIVVEKIGRNPPHSSTLRKLIRLLSRVLPPEYFLSFQLPITLETSEPEPDLAIVRGREEDFDTRHPGADDVAIVIEISDESIAKDFRDKGRLYADSKIPEYWIVNLTDSTVEVQSNPTDFNEQKYQTHSKYTRTDPVPLILGGQKVADVLFEDILP